MKKDNIKLIVNTTLFVFGVALLALNYNLFLVPRNLVVGGLSGLSIIFKEWFGWNTSIFMYVGSIGLLIVSYLFLGKKESVNTVIGSILYPVMITITEPIAKYILLKSDLNEFLVALVIASCLYGVACGLIYKTGYTTGGGDIIMHLLAKYLKMSLTTANFIYSSIIIALCGYVFGMSSFVNALILLFISNIIINKILVGVSNSKVFFIATKKEDEIKEIIKEEYHSGCTLLQTKSNMFHKKSEVIMVVIPTRVYHAFKNRILEIDKDAFFVINDCYEVNGGVRIENIPYF